jgi:hypothetical protein
MYNDAVVRLTSGSINKVNDAVVGSGGTNIGPQIGAAVGQLGSGWYLDDSQLLFDSTMGTVFGGHFRYVRLRVGAAAVVVGQIVFWDTIANAADNLFQVTELESGSADTAMRAAGIVLNSGWTAGNYSVIQDLGPTKVKFRATLTAAGAAGSRVFAAAAGGADLGFADVIDSANPALFSDVSKMMGRYLGVADETPTNGGLKTVMVAMHNVRG